MHRLTERDSGGTPIPVSTGYSWIPKIVKRLAEYEDLNYDENGEEIISISGIRDLLEKEGIKQ